MPVLIEIEIPDGEEKFRLPEEVNRRLQTLLGRQDGGQNLSREEREEAEGLVDLAERLSLLRLRARWLSGGASCRPATHTTTP